MQDSAHVFHSISGCKWMFVCDTHTAHHWMCMRLLEGTCTDMMLNEIAIILRPCSAFSALILGFRITLCPQVQTSHILSCAFADKASQRPLLVHFCAVGGATVHMADVQALVRLLSSEASMVKSFCTCISHCHFLSPQSSEAGR